jgi:hypothetical protein
VAAAGYTALTYSRDLHARNVLVAQRFYAANPGNGAYEAAFLIADLGEGQILDNANLAPENNSYEVGNARDIQALGQLIWAMVQKQWEASGNKSNAELQVKHYLPLKVLDVILQCMSDVGGGSPRRNM